MKYVHEVIHDLRNQLGEELQYLEETDELPDLDEKLLTDASIQSLYEALQEILDSASSCFRELTGTHCTAVLIMPEQSEEDGKHFKSRLYSCNAPPERTKHSLPHKSGMVVKAFTSDTVLICNDLLKEMSNGNFEKGYDDPFKWYRSTMLCHFKVCGDPWGILSIDAPTTRVFRYYYNDVICAFADACGLAFTLSEHGDFGNHVYQTNKN